MASFDVDVTSNKDEVLAELQNKVGIALEMIGLKAEGYAKGYCPVDTGRLRNSISHTADDDSAYIGTNVEYAPYVEFGTRRMHPKHYLQQAVQNHIDEYRQTAENIFKE